MQSVTDAQTDRQALTNMPAPQLNFFDVGGIKMIMFCIVHFWFDFCFMALQHILGHFGRGHLP